MVGKRSEQGGIIKDGAKMVNAVANSTVPKITIIVGNSYGAGNYAMCGKAYDPRFIYAWPSARIAVMGGAQAAQTLLQIEVATREKRGMSVTEEDKQAFLNVITTRYDRQSDVTYAAARLWVDEIIDPAETRERISAAIDTADHNPDMPPFRNGVIQV
jgi:acetyl-CoA carboxylase carboxyltransferase component